MKEQLSCVFCSIDPAEIIESNQSMTMFFDKYPVTKDHMLIIPKEHRSDFFDLNDDEYRDFRDLLDTSKKLILKRDPKVTGFNIGMNCGLSAGQTIFHCHIHLIPRRDGDMDNPAGGVRGVIPQKQKY